MKRKLENYVWHKEEIKFNKLGLFIGDEPVMQYWEKPLMKRLAHIVTETKGDVLECGFGLGLSASEIIKSGCKSYTVIEAHPEIAENAKVWGKKQKVKVTVINDYWQNAVKKLTKKFDAILFDTYPLSEEERSKNHYPFIPQAFKLLKKGGLLTYYSDETKSFRQEHLHILLEHYKTVTLERFDIKPPKSCVYWGSDHMIIPIAKK
ncbi:MAG: class I SAM-dependent methyltransferase [Alphaproteobacteria bacterium]